MSSLAQKSHRDSSIFIASLGIHYGYHFVGGNMKNTYGNNHAVGADATFKLKNGISIGADFEYYFSENVKNRDSYFKNISNYSGNIIDGNGRYAEVNLYERGYNIQIFAGYQFHQWGPNPNSGPFIHLGVGFMEYHTRIENPEKTAPQIKDEYIKMYDRLRNGFSSTQFFGYRFMGNRNLANIYFGVEFTEAWTANRRSYNADLKPEELGIKFDFLTAIKVGWIIPFYGRAPKEYYYY